MLSITKLRQYLWFCAIALVASACTQQPAPVEDRSAQFYGREPSASNSSYHGIGASAPAAPHYYTTQAAAPAPSVGVLDLPPPAASNSPAALSPIPPADTHAPMAAGSSKFIWPVAGGKVISSFGNKPGGRSNDGINIAVSEGEPVWAAADGMVVYAGNQLPSYGNMIILRHDDGLMTAYAHMRSLSARKNDYVKQGEIIGYVGMTGSVRTPQLHFAVREGKTPVDPERYLPGG